MVVLEDTSIENKVNDVEETIDEKNETSTVFTVESILLIYLPKVL